MLKRLRLGWLSFCARIGICTIQQHDLLRGEIANLNHSSDAQISYVMGELKQLHYAVAPQLQFITGELTKLHDHSVALRAQIDSCISEGRDNLLKEIEESRREFSWLAEQLSLLHSHVMSNLEAIRDEQSRIHTLATTRLTGQLEYLNSQLYCLKQCLYHPDLSIVPNAFNGQFSKHRIFADLCARFQFDCFVETGANEGATTDFLCRQGKRVYAVEVDPIFYGRAATRLSNQPFITLRLGDSADFLNEIAMNILEQELAFFYLDAHWGDHLPLKRELEIISAHHRRSVVMIDDFKVEDDSGYGYDIYAEGQEITLAFLGSTLAQRDWQVFFPALPSAQDHMATDILLPRGTAILTCDPEIAVDCQNIRSLRHWKT